MRTEVREEKEVLNGGQYEIQVLIPSMEEGGSWQFPHSHFTFNPLYRFPFTHAVHAVHPFPLYVRNSPERGAPIPLSWTNTRMNNPIERDQPHLPTPANTNGWTTYMAKQRTHCINSLDSLYWIEWVFRVGLAGMARQGNDTSSGGGPSKQLT
jgi:hypothetical protein